MKNEQNKSCYHNVLLLFFLLLVAVGCLNLVWGAKKKNGHIAGFESSDKKRKYGHIAGIAEIRSPDTGYVSIILYKQGNEARFPIFEYKGLKKGPMEIQRIDTLEIEFNELESCQVCFIFKNLELGYYFLRIYISLDYNSRPNFYLEHKRSVFPYDIQVSEDSVSILNASVTAIFSPREDILELDQFFDSVVRHLEVYWPNYCGKKVSVSNFNWGCKNVKICNE